MYLYLEVEQTLQIEVLFLQTHHIFETLFVELKSRFDLFTA